ncbi:hypothetical protein CCACVL1_09480, partial [Corchorus capsularis]
VASLNNEDQANNVATCLRQYWNKSNDSYQGLALVHRLSMWWSKIKLVGYQKTRVREED